MIFNRNLKRWTATAILAALAFTQASLAIAACEMDRRALAAAIALEYGHDCQCETDSAGQAIFASNRCVAHCTSDLQISVAFAPVLTASPPAVVLPLPRGDPTASLSAFARAPRPPGVPMRVFLHSFLI